ncbi:MAG: radical SAM protein [Acidobacteria bacterium]|nr:radical SAM protein [Acidobacteriota bacterium]MBI3658833.1 radical SAM protein [Acidobacteriota bacterium]
MYVPHLIFWEVTKGCNLRCIHCRATPTELASPADLSTEEAFRVIDEIASVSQSILVLSGGEPLFRRDLFDIAAYGTQRGLRMALATNGTLVTQEVAQRVLDAGIQRVSISLDGGQASTHDSFRAIPGAFDGAIRGFRNLKAVGMSMQINTTITNHNYKEIDNILKLALELGTDAWHLFLLVPVGCGLGIADEQMLSAQTYEVLLNWIYDQSKVQPMNIKATCAPHYFRVRAQRILQDRKEGREAPAFNPARHGHPNTGGDGNGGAHPWFSLTKGCLAGTGICFISHKGEVNPCGYLPILAGDLRRDSFADIWRDSSIFEQLRDMNNLTGKCGLCEFKHICEGCRARAFAATGDYLAEEPFCVYEPRR